MGLQDCWRLCPCRIVVVPRGNLTKCLPPEKKSVESTNSSHEGRSGRYSGLRDQKVSHVEKETMCSGSVSIFCSFQITPKFSFLAMKWGCSSVVPVNGSLKSARFA